MDTEILRGELERLFELEELLSLCQEVLGFPPEAVGGTGARGSFASALLDHCLRTDAVEALCDAVLATRPGADPRLEHLRANGPSFQDELPAGSTFADVTLVRKLGEGRVGICYLGRRGDADLRIKLLRREPTRDRRGLQRFLTVTRLLGQVDHPSLPRGLTVLTEGERTAIVHRYLDAPTLAERLARNGAMHLNEARPMLQAVLEGLRAIHDRRLAHGDLRTGNVLLQRTADGALQVLLLDAGTEKLRARPRIENGQSELFSTVASPKILAPELIRGHSADPRTDVYAFGAVLYEVLTGKPVFDATTALEFAVGHLTRDPDPPSSKAPRGWISAELDDLVLSLLAKSPVDRPQDAGAVLEALELLERNATVSRKSEITDEQIDERVATLMADPADTNAAVALEEAVDRGAEAGRIAEAFGMAASELSTSDAAEQREAQKALLFRAARLYAAARDDEAAERTYVRLLELDPGDDIAVASLEEIRRRLGKYEDVVEMLLGRSEQAQSAAERARALVEIGRLYARELQDPEQALVAFTQALCESPEAAPSEDIERLAADRQASWWEVLGQVAEAAGAEGLAFEHKRALLGQLGRWYLEKVSRPDLALAAYQAIVADEPSNLDALEGLCRIYRKAQQWPELVTALLRRADATPTPARARDARAEAAEVLEFHLNEPARARDLYQQVLQDDPGHSRAGDALVRGYERAGDFAALAALLEQRADARSGEERLALMTRIAEVYEDRLDDASEAIRRYRAVLDLDAEQLDALRGLDRLYAKTGRYQELLDNLEQQIRLAATPRQKIALHERIAGVYEEEFLDHERAAQALEEILRIDPSHPGALSNLARHYQKLERWEELADLYDRKLRAAADDDQKVEMLLARGELLAAQIGSPERAMQAYEAAVALRPEHSGALEALARLREKSGDADAALAAIEALAEQASGEARAEQYQRAARLLEARGDRDGAIERYKLALDAAPTSSAIAAALREAYVARGDVNAAIQLLERELEHTEGDRAKARLMGQAATLCRTRLKDDKRAEELARKAIALDPTDTQALIVLGDIAFEHERHLEAAHHYASLADRADALDPPQAQRILIRYVDALTHTGSTEKALASMDTLLRIAPDDVTALERAAQVTFEHGSPARSVELHSDLLSRFGDRLGASSRALALYRKGESLRREGALEAAIPLLEQACDLDPSRAAPLESLAQAHASQEDWERVLSAKTRQLDLASGDQRVKLLLEIGDLAAGKLGDRTRATKSFVAALEERPEDRRLLTKLMQLYSEEKDWNKLVEVVLRLADFVDDPKQKTKYLHTAAIVSHKEMGDIDRALGIYDQVLELDPGFSSALDEAIDLQEGRHDFEGVERLLQRKLARATADKDQRRMLDTFDRLGRLYEQKLGWMDRAIDAYEAAQTLDPDDRERLERLAELYAIDPGKHIDKAVATQLSLLRQNPYRVESFKALRRLYTETKRADAAFCVCQALWLNNLAEPDEERFFKRMRPETAAPAQAALSDEDWLTLLMHAGADPLLTSLFALIEPAVIAKRSPPLEELGYDPSYAIDLAQHAYPIGQTLYYAAGVLGMEPPPTFENPNDPGGLGFLHAHAPSVVLGLAALQAELPSQPAAFIAARHLTYYRPGMYMRQLVPFGTGLKAWLFAAIKLIAPQFPIATDLEGPVRENLVALDTGLVGASREHLARVVSKLLQTGAALDLKRWVAGVDLTADRAGFLVAHDLEVAMDIVRASDDAAAAAPVQERMKELLLYSVSAQYLELRQRLGITID